MSETQVVLELTGILVYQLVRGAGCLDLGQAIEEQAWLQESHAMIFIEFRIVQVTHLVLTAYSVAAVLPKRNASIKKCHKNAKINFTKVQEKIYRNAWHNCTKAHNTC